MSAHMCSLGSLYIKILEIGCVVLSWRAGGAPGAHAPCDGTRSVTTVLCACGEVSLYLLVVLPCALWLSPVVSCGFEVEAEGGR